jgi:adenine phosphoribosyltransferase
MSTVDGVSTAERATEVLTALGAAVSSAPAVHIPASATHAPYVFRAYDFGELGLYLDPELIREIRDGLSTAVASFGPFDSIVSPEPGGHTWGLLVADQLGCGLHILRRDPPAWFGVRRRSRRTAYSSCTLCYGDLARGERVVIVDDVVSSGSTLRSIAAGLRSQGADAIGAQVILSKGGCDGLSERLGLPVRALVGPPS